MVVVTSASPVSVMVVGCGVCEDAMDGDEWEDRDKCEWYKCGCE